MMQRDVPSFDKYTLSEQTKQALKTPEFDIWQWEPNEVSKIFSPTYDDIHSTFLKVYKMLVSYSIDSDTI